jgi:hypothetical protein
VELMLVTQSSLMVINMLSIFSHAASYTQLARTSLVMASLLISRACLTSLSSLTKMVLTTRVASSFQVVLTSFLKFRLRQTKHKKKLELQRMPHKFWAQLVVVLVQLMQARL